MANQLTAINRGRRGFVLATTTLAAVAMVGAVGLAIDVGQAYIVRSEAQAHVDAAALAAALELDGTAEGITRATSQVANSLNRWRFDTQTFTGTQVEFSTDPAGPWESVPASPAGYRFARVGATANIPLLFVRVLVPQDTALVAARAVAGQVPKQRFIEGIFPFSPYAHDPNDHVDGGLTPGQIYTLRWPNSFNKNATYCPADNNATMIDLAESAGAQTQGYIEDNSADVIREAIEGDAMSTGREYDIGTPLMMSSGQKQTEHSSLINRINQDTDTSSATYAEYEAAGEGNGRRLVVVPINGGPSDFAITTFGLFFLLPASEYQNSPLRPFCAEYVGPGVLGGKRKGAGGPGVYVVRLVQ